MIERALGAEMGLHLGYPHGAPKPLDAANHRNGSTAKTVVTDTGKLRVDIPRDRDGSFEPLLIPKHQRRFTGFDDKIIGLYARGVSVREIQAFLLEAYGTEVSAGRWGLVAAWESGVRPKLLALLRWQHAYIAQRRPVDTTAPPLRRY